jgi:acetyl-CoA acyltransferase
VSNPAVFVVGAVRTPFGPHEGKLGKWHAVDLLAAAFGEALERSGFAPDDLDQVLAGCAVPIGEQAVNVARNATLATGWPESVPAHTIDAQGSSGVVALHEAFARVRSGLADVCLVGAVASTRVPDGATSGVAVGKPFGARVHERFADIGGLRPPGAINEHLAARFSLTRNELDAFAKQSHEAFEAGQADEKRSIVELSDTKRIPTVVSVDETQRLADIEGLSPLFENDGLLTAATFALPANGAAAIVVASANAVKRRSLRSNVLAEIIACDSAGSSMVDGSTGVVLAAKVLDRHVGSDNNVLIDVEEDSAVAPVAFARQSNRHIAAVNRRGGALALGNPFGVSGLASVVRLIHHHDDQSSHGLAVTAGANGISTGTLLEFHNNHSA